MGIVRSDKRQTSIELLKELHSQIESAMRILDSLQASAESLELELGLASEGEQAQRAQYLVMHYPTGEDKGHSLDECTDDCNAEEVLQELEETKPEGDQ